MGYPDPKYFATPSLQQTYFNKVDASVLASGVVYFYKDNARTVLKPVYQITELPGNTYGFVELPNPLTLSSTGVFVNPSTGTEIIPYLYPYVGEPADNSGVVELYYVKVLNSSGVLQVEQPAWPPGVPIPASDTNITGASNLFSNSQFTQVLFIPDLGSAYKVFTVSGTNTVTALCPGWDLVTSGSGTVTVRQFAVIETTSITNPPYALDIQGGGSLTSLRLRQRFSNTPRLVAGGFLSGSFVVNSQDTDSHVITMTYVPSVGTSHTIVSFTTTGTLGFESATGATEIDGTINTDNATTGYVDIFITIPPLAHIQLSSLQLVQVGNATTFPTYVQESVQEQQEYLYWYWEPKLKEKAIPSYLVGWDFALNPKQFFVSPQTVTTATYTWDKTIARSVTGSITVVSHAPTGAFQVQTNSANTAFYLLQYISGENAKAMVSNSMSMNMEAWTSTVVTPPTVRFYLFRASSSGAIPALPSTIGTLNADGSFTLTEANWGEVPRGGLGQASSTVSPTVASLAEIQTIPDIGFSGWQITNGTDLNDTDKFAVVVTFFCPTNSTGVLIKSISLVPGAIPTRPAPLSFDETLRMCQYEYEKSWSVETAVGTATAAGCVERTMLINPPEVDPGTLARTLHPRTFQLQFRQTKRTASYNVVLYATSTGASASVTCTIMNGGAVISTGVASTSSWTQTGKGKDELYFLATSVADILTSTVFLGNLAEAFITFHYTVDGRAGIV